MVKDNEQEQSQEVEQSQEIEQSQEQENKLDPEKLATSQKEATTLAEQAAIIKNLNSLAALTDEQLAVQEIENSSTSNSGPSDTGTASYDTASSEPSIELLQQDQQQQTHQASRIQQAIKYHSYSEDGDNQYNGSIGIEADLGLDDSSTINAVSTTSSLGGSLDIAADGDYTYTPHPM